MLPNRKSSNGFPEARKPASPPQPPLRAIAGEGEFRKPMSPYALMPLCPIKDADF